MRLKHFLLLLHLLYFLLFLSGCNKDWEPVSSENGIYQTTYGAVTQIDNYPLYKMTYTSDYKFDEYLQTGTIPNFNLTYIYTNKFACTCFSAFGDTSRFLGRNYDWNSKRSYYLVFTSPLNGYSSVSTVDLGFFNYNPAQPPTSSENQEMLRTIPYFPFDGMNEKGVAVGMNALSTAQSPYDPNKVTIGELQLIRLVLDYAATTSEAITLIQQYNIRIEQPPIHYLIADSSGHSVIIEFVNGNMEVMNNTEYWQITTNFVITGTNLQNPPCWRYQTAESTLEQNNGYLTHSSALNLLHSVSVSGTRWSALFNLKRRKMQIAMGRDFNNTHHFTIR